MKKMNWNQDAWAYEGETSDGLTVSVAGDYWAEEKADGINTLIDERGINRENLSVEEDNKLIDGMESEVLENFDNPDWWAMQAEMGDNPDVRYVD